MPTGDLNSAFDFRKVYVMEIFVLFNCLLNHNVTQITRFSMEKNVYKKPYI